MLSLTKELCRQVLSQERVLKILQEIGFTETEAQIYLLLSKRGLQRVREISKALKIKKQLIYPSLKNLQNKGIVNVTIEHPARFHCIPLEKVIDIALQTKLDEVKHLEENKKDIITDWRSIRIEEEGEQKPTFMVLKGRSAIQAKIQSMLSDTQDQLRAITTIPSLLQADQTGIFDQKTSTKQKKYRFIAELPRQYVEPLKEFLNQEASNNRININGRTPHLGLNSFSQMLIRDQQEALFFISALNKNPIIEKTDVCLWTDCEALIQSFIAIFEDVWINSTDIQSKAIELETGKPPPRIYPINKTFAAKQFKNMLNTAKEEIILLTSPEGLQEIKQEKALLELLSDRGITIKIMAPITSKNSDDAKELMVHCEVKHVPVNYWKTLIVDGKHLLQFNPDKVALQSVFYTEDPEYLTNMKIALNDIWKQAVTPSSTNISAFLEPQNPPEVPMPSDSILEKGDASLIDMEPPGTINEHEILNKMVNAKKITAKNASTDISRMYASMAMAVIHPPTALKLPDIIIQATHANKQSSHGSGDFLVVFLSLQPESTHSFIPVAILVEESLKDQDIFKLLFAGSPAAQNIQIAKNEEIEVRVHGNTLFAGWTVPIKLFPQQYTLPPACMLIEGYGKMKSEKQTILHPSGFKSEMETNYFDAFVTFIHSSSKYSGPGTEALLARDFIMTKYPPKKTQVTKI